MTRTEKMLEMKLNKALNRKINSKKKFAEQNGNESPVLKEVLHQIEVLEELGRGLNETQILDLLKKQNTTQVQNTCRVIKVA